MNLRYPIGIFEYEDDITADLTNMWIADIEVFPSLLLDAVKGLNDKQLDTTYRPDGWTVRQVVHHLADSHMNSYIRFKLALTENTPVIKSYNESKWAELADSTLPVDISLTLLETLHKRWAHLLRSLSPADLKNTFNHPDSGEVSVARNIGIYAWHGKHHLAQITALCNDKGW